MSEEKDDDKHVDSEEELLNNINISRQRNIRIYRWITQDLVRQLLFIASILAGFIFTILFDLVLAPQYINNYLLSVVFSFLLISGFSLLVSIILGAMLQFLSDAEFLEGIMGKKSFLAGSAFDFFMWGTIATIAAFLFGIFCFVVSITLFGWLRSPWFGCLSGLLLIALGFITFFAIRQIILMLIQTFEALDQESLKER